MANTLKFGNGEWYGKKDTILAYNSENGNFKPLAFNFDRETSATVINKDGLIETVGSGQPRVDYKDNSKGALLLEPSRTNLLPYSNDYSQSVYTRRNCNITQNYAISPNGNMDATRVVANGSDAAIFDNIGVTSGVEYTLSVYLKVESGTLDTTITLGSAGFPDTVGDGGRFKNITVTEQWQRFTLISTADASVGSQIGVIGGFGGFNNGDEVYIWGAQLEQGSYPTSYIPTQGGVVTRLADECEQIPPDGVIGQTELTIFYQGIVERLGGNDGHAITLSQSADGAGSSRILLYRNSSNGNMYVYVQDTTTQFSTPLLANSNPQINDKYAIAIKDNDLVVYCNGVKVSENNSGTIPATQYLIFNKWNNQINEQNKIKEVKLYNTRLSNSELQALTSN